MKNKSSGFTLVELAIVLVIIGIILGAVIKGQDLIQNARAKKVVSKVKEWEIAQWNFLDRKGRFAGDQNKSGLIGDDGGDDVKTDLVNANFINPPYEGSAGSETNTITVGSYKFYVFFGYDTGNNKNVMVLCKSTDCNTAFTADDLVFVEAVDSSIDGVADGTVGNVICSTANGSPSTTTWINTINPTADGCNTSAKTLIYYFDSKR